MVLSIELGLHMMRHISVSCAEFLAIRNNSVFAVECCPRSFFLVDSNLAINVSIFVREFLEFLNIDLKSG